MMEISPDKYNWLRDSKELKKAIVARMLEIGVNTYGCCELFGYKIREVHTWLYLHTVQPIEGTKGFKKLIFVLEICDALGIRIHDAPGGKYIIEIKPLEFITLPLYQRKKYGARN
jgi:hypothetical protein